MAAGEAMHTVHTRARTGADGVLVLRVASGLVNVEVEVTVIVSPAPAAPLDRPAWRRFLGETAGRVADPSFISHLEGGFETRDRWG